MNKVLRHTESYSGWKYNKLEQCYFESTSTLAYKKKSLFPSKKWFSMYKIINSLHQRVVIPNWAKGFWRKTLLIIISVILLFSHYCLPLKTDIILYLNKFEFDFQKMLCPKFDGNVAMVSSWRKRGRPFEQTFLHKKVVLWQVCFRLF